MLVLSSDVIYTIINVLLLVVLLRIFLWKPVLNMIEKRRQTIQNDLDEAARKNTEAGETLAKYETSLADARKESAALVEQAKARAGEQYDAIVAQANQDAAAIRQQAERDALRQRDQMMDQARDELADVVLLAASKLLGTTVDEETDRRLVDEWLRGGGGLS